LGATETNKENTKQEEKVIKGAGMEKNE